MNYSKYFTTSTRENGDTFTHLIDSAPEYLSDFCHSAHDGMFPDDYKFSFILEAFEAAENHDSIDEARESIEAHHANHELIKWLGSHGERQGYCDEAIDEYGIDMGSATVMQIIGMGQYKEKSEIFEMAVRFIEDQAED